MASLLSRLFFLTSLIHAIFITPTYAKEKRTKPKSKKTPIVLTDYDKRVLENGEISGFRRAAGTVLAIFPGFGLGHAVQGRYQYKGMIFTLTELGSLAILAGPTGDGGLGIGILSLLGFKVWEFIDSIVGPERDNARYRELQSLAFESDDSGFRMFPMPLTKNNDTGKQSTHLGLALTWNIP